MSSSLGPLRVASSRASRLIAPESAASSQRRALASFSSKAQASRTQCCPAFRTANNHTYNLRNHLRPLPKSFQRQSYRYQHDSTQKMSRAFIALGSNMGDRIAMIEQACKEMEATGKIKITRTSSLWETKAMYVLDQNNFVNGACQVSITKIGTIAGLT
jgi:hypothetical protein